MANKEPPLSSEQQQKKKHPADNMVFIQHLKSVQKSVWLHVHLLGPDRYVLFFFLQNVLLAVVKHFGTHNRTIKLNNYKS